MHIYQENKTRTSYINGIRDVLAKTLLICSYKWYNLYYFFIIICYEYIKFAFYSRRALWD